MTRFIFLLSVITFSSAGCSKPPTNPYSAPKTETVIVSSVININTASADDLQRIPHVGEKLANKIIEHRETYGPFRRVEHLMLIQGISDKRFRKIRPLVRVE